MVCRRQVEMGLGWPRLRRRKPGGGKLLREGVLSFCWILSACFSVKCDYFNCILFEEQLSYRSIQSCCCLIKGYRGTRDHKVEIPIRSSQLAALFSFCSRNIS